MKKLLWLGTISLLTILFCGCGKKTETKEIEFLTNRTDYVSGTADASGKKDPQTAYFKILADKFKKETGITVKLTGYSNYSNAVRRRFASGDYGDVITLPDTSFSDKDLKNFFQPIGTADTLSDYRFTNLCSIGDEVYGIGTSYNITGAVYNKKVFTEAGFKEFPKTLPDLHKAFAKIKANGKIPVILNRANLILGQVKPIVYSYSGTTSTFNKMWDTESPFSKDKPFGMMLNEIATWTNKGWVEPEFINDWEGSKTKVASGEAGVMFLGSWGYPQVKNRTVSCPGAKPEDICFAAFPICIPYQNTQYAAAGAGMPIVISKKTKNFEAAKKWVEFLANSNFEKYQGGFPIRKDTKDYAKGFDPIMNEVNAGKVTLLLTTPSNKYHGLRTVEILKDMDMLADHKYIGKALDSARKSMKDFDEYIKQLNKQFNEVRKARGYTSN